MGEAEVEDTMRCRRTFFLEAPNDEDSDTYLDFLADNIPPVDTAPDGGLHVEIRGC